MRKARSMRGGPVSARIVLALLALSMTAAVLLSGGTEDAGASTSALASVGDVLESDSSTSGAVYQTAAVATSPIPVSSTSDLLRLVSRSSIARGAELAASEELAADLATDSQLVAGAEPEASEPLEQVEFLDDDEDDQLALEHAAHDLLVIEDAEEHSEQVFQGVLGSGETISAALRSRGVSAGTVHVISKELRGVFNFRRSQPGHRFHLVQSVHGEVLDFRYRVSQEESIHLSRDHEGGYVAVREAAELVPHISRMAGVVSSSLYEAIESLGEQPALANTFANVFAWEIDFTRNVQPGDEFQMLYERLFRRDAEGFEEYVRPGRVLAARYRSGNEEWEAVHFEPRDGRGGYYRPDGTSVERQFLSAPLDYTRVSSGYSAARRHPILKITRAHHGIDYAAPHGTPVWSVADGTVIFRGRAGGFGNLVKIRHANGYVSYYSHLSAFEKGLHVGQRVKQKQTIGKIGSTGLATGPHTCFRIAQNGRYVNPRRIESPAADPITEASWSGFASTRDTLMASLDGRELAAVEEAM